MRPAARDGGPAPALQLLIYPATDFTRRRRSGERFGQGFLLTRSRCRFAGFTHAFIAAAGVSRDARMALVEIAGATRGMFGAVRPRTAAPIVPEPSPPRPRGS